MNLSGVFENLLTTFGNLLPGVLGALLILLIGWMIAKGVRGLIIKLMKKTDLDDKLLGNASVDPGRMVANLVYYLIMLVVLMVVLEKMGISYVLDPIKDMVGQFFAFVPNLVGAGVIGFVGYILAQISSGLVGTGGNAITNVAGKMGLGTDMDIVGLLQKILFGFILAIFGIMALDTLGIEAISGPANDLLRDFIGIIPKILVCVIIIGLFFFIGRYASTLLKELLRGMKVDDMSSRLGLSSMLGKQTLSSLISSLVFFFVVFIGIITGVEQLGFGQLSGILNNLLALSGKIAFGLVILVAGNFIANIAANAVGANNKFLGTVVRFAILAIFVTMGFSQMGIGGGIVNTAFSLMLGAVAVAVALAYGLGGREAAGEHMKDIIGKFRK